MRTVLRLPNWVGDAVLALPAVAAWSAQGERDLVLAGRRLPLQIAGCVARHAEPLELGGAGGRPSGLWRDVARLRTTGASRGILLTPSLSAALWLRLGGVRERWGWDEQGRGFLLTHRVRRSGRREHIVEQLHGLAMAPLRRGDGGPVAAAADPVLPADQVAQTAAARFLEAAGLVAPRERRPLVALCPGVRYGTAKRWPIVRFAQLAKRLAAAGIAGLVLGSEAEQPLGAEICGAAAAVPASPPARWQNACGAGSLLFAAELLRRCAVGVCSDTGTMHLAAAVGTPVVALFGPTDPNWTRPRGTAHRVLRHDFPCAPCLRRHCPYGDPAPCMAALSVEEVAECAGGLAAARASGLAPRGGRPALFLDRDGTLIELEPYLQDPSRVRLTLGSAAALRAAQAAGYLLVVVTNQSGIARGLFTPAAVDAVHTRLRSLLAAEGVELSAVYVCPHHPDFSGPCACRKPAPGLLQQAIRELAIEPVRSVMIGDTVEDLQAGAIAGLQPRLVRTGYGAEHADRRAAELPAGTRIFDDLAAAIDDLP